MKTLIPFIFLVVFLMCSMNQGRAQTNQATIFTLEDNNLTEIVNQVVSFLAPVSSNPPSAIELTNFFSSAYTNRVYIYSPSSCDSPGLNVSQKNGTVTFLFENFGSGYPDALFVSELEYGGPLQTSQAVYGPEAYNGLEFPIGNVQQHIFLVGSLCSDCTSSFINHCASKWEIIIIEKNIL